jgi:hypothetical protein
MSSRSYWLALVESERRAWHRYFDAVSRLGGCYGAIATSTAERDEIHEEVQAVVFNVDRLHREWREAYAAVECAWLDARRLEDVGCGKDPGR